MYTVVLLAAMTTSGGAPAGHKGHVPSSCPNCWPGYHNSGGWGLPYGGYNWPGYACWGGCGGYASAAYGVPMTPLLTPPPPRAYDPDEDEDGGKDKKGGNGKKKSGKDEGDESEGKDKKGKPKKPSKDEDESISAKVTFLVPAGAKLYVDGRQVTVAGTKTFTTPPLQKGAEYYYEVKAEVMRDGMPMVETRQVTVKAGASIRADFRNLGDRGVAAK